MTKKTLLLIACFVAFVLPAFSQEKAELPAASAGAPNMFVELGGNGAFLSLNYDMRFSKSNKGLGGRAGIGFFPGFSFGFGATSSFVTIPIALNYLAGKGPNHLEIGAGATYASGAINIGGAGANASGFVFVPSIGYRYQPLTKGFTGRVIVSPFIGSDGAQFWLGISGGVRF